MLARTPFMPATDLGITEVERDALIKVLKMLESGQISDDQFNMSILMNDCHTVGCLCGWANIVSDGKAFPGVDGRLSQASATLGNLPSELKKLFWTGIFNIFRLWRPTTEQGAAALHTYLTTGKSGW
jgi:hypothetical protein